jgi:hypothetical protein
LNPDAGTSKDTVAIKSNDVGLAGGDLLWFINPFTWIGMIFGTSSKSR